MSRLALAVLIPGFFLCVLSRDEAVSSKCGGYTLYKDAGGYLMYHEIPVIFDDAKKRCAVEGGVLASPINVGIKAALIDILKTRNVEKNVFTGFSAEPHNGGIFSSIEGTWLSNIEHTWADGEPNNYWGNENCIVLTPHGTMSDVKCDNRYPYVCFLSEERVKHVCGVDNIVGDYPLDNTTGSCYKFHNTTLGYDKAAKVCEEEGGHLLIINGDNEAQAAKNLIGKNGVPYAILGFQYNTDSGKWITLQGETIEDAGYAKWPISPAPAPNLMHQFGLLGNDGLLNYSAPSDVWPFICEKCPVIVVCE